MQDIQEIYKVCQKKNQLPTVETRLASLFRCLATQMTNQLQSMCLNSMRDFDRFIRSFSEERGIKDAGFVTYLKPVQDEIHFNPPFKKVEMSLLDSYDIMMK